MSDSPLHPIIGFYLGESPDHRGRFIDDLWNMTHDELETCHDYIQWLFPNWTASRFSPAAPLLDEEVCQAFLNDAELQARLLESFDVMLDFYGLARNGEEFVRSPDFERRSGFWLTTGNHNHLRLTRILLCLWSVGFPELASSLHRCLVEIDRRFPGRFSERTWAHWNDAVRLPRSGDSAQAT
jgi:hypothetical protein